MILLQQDIKIPHREWHQIKQGTHQDGLCKGGQGIRKERGVWFLGSKCGEEFECGLVGLGSEVEQCGNLTVADIFKQFI